MLKFAFPNQIESIRISDYVDVSMRLLFSDFMPSAFSW